MPGPNSHPLGGKSRFKREHTNYNQSANQMKCAIRQGGGKFRGVCNCPKHPSK